MDDTTEDISQAVTAIGRIDAVPTLLAVLCEITGMRFAAVAHATDTIGPPVPCRMISTWA